ncbi:MAG: CBS domain-containing protein [Sinobacteraceae bacterium]|jgi:CBS domain-containing protein|nr:CBS domain-containing protein [Nevskiaceae bacterium]
MATLDSVKVRDYMTTKLITFTPDMEVMAAVNLLVKHGISGAPVLDKNGKLVGMLSERDCLQIAFIAAQDTCVAGPVSQLMSKNVVTVDPDMNLTQLAGMFSSQPYRRYPVVENGKLVGQISRSDVMRAINSLC